MICTLPQIIEQTADRVPEKEAFRMSGQGISYSQLVAKSNALAHALRDQGVKKGDRVGLYFNKSLESAIALNGIWKAGAAYVPLDPFAPVSRLAWLIADCGIRHLITEPTKSKQVAQLSQNSQLDCLIGWPDDADSGIRTLSWQSVFTAPSQIAPDIILNEQDLAYIMYTSGSTGIPKGLMHTHRSGLSYAKLAQETYDLQQDDRLSNHPPLHFDMSTFDFFSGPLAGATTVIIPEAYTKFPASLSKLIADEQLTVWYSVPFALIQLLLRGVLDERNLSALRWVIFAGEPFPTKHLRNLMKALPQAQFSNAYGPAEVNVCTYYHVPSLPKNSEESISIGQPWGHNEALVLDEADQPVADGRVGELLIKTPTMMRGYWNRPDLDQRAFYHCPKLNDTNENQWVDERFYRTGDLVQRQADGNYRFLGRKDRQIKTRGHRVELDEVENALLSHPQVEEAAVFLGAEIDGSHQIEAAILAKAEQILNEASLLKYLKNQLPWYAVPTKITVTNALPRTSSGKIDRNQLAKAMIG